MSKPSRIVLFRVAPDRYLTQRGSKLVGKDSICRSAHDVFRCKFSEAQQWEARGLGSIQADPAPEPDEPDADDGVADVPVQIVKGAYLRWPPRPGDSRLHSSGEVLLVTEKEAARLCGKKIVKRCSDLLQEEFDPDHDEVLDSEEV